MTLSPNKKIYISLIVFFAIFFAVAFFVILPIVSAIRNDSQRLSVEKKAQSSFSKERQTFKEFEKVYEELEPDLEKANDVFVDSEVPISFIDFLERTAYSSNILIEISSVDLIKDKKDIWPSLKFQLEIFGSFSNCLKFLERLENSTYLINIQGLGVSRLNEDSLGSKGEAGFSVGDISAKVSLKVFAK